MCEKCEALKKKLGADSLKKFDMGVIKAIVTAEKPIKAVLFVEEDRKRSEFVVYENGKYDEKYVNDFGEIKTNGTPKIACILEGGAEKIFNAVKKITSEEKKKLERKLTRVQTII